jgi:dipeptidase
LKRENQLQKFIIMKHIILLSIFSLLGIYQSNACTNFLITKGASSDGSTMITYAADSHTLYGELYHLPAKTYPEGSMLDVYEWDTGKYLGKINQVGQTYNVVGNINEYQVAISETTFGGREELESQPGAVIDYGSLMYIALQRSKTAREAIEVMTSLVQEYGYYSSGESFSISDPNEVWIMEMIGKGKFEKGAVWVALRVPDGYVSGHANQARITNFSMKDPQNCLYSKDVITFAKARGWFEGPDSEFSFSDTYAPVNFGAARFCEARVWAGFNKITTGMEQYTSYAMGKVEKDNRGYATNKLPLWVKPSKKLSVADVIDMMRDHYQGTVLDMTQDPGAGPYQLPYRWRPLTWSVDSVMYCNERAISTQQTGFSFVSQSRSWLPNPIGGILWFGLDDSYSSCYMPMYCGITEIPLPVKVGNGDMLTYSETSAFWAFNLVANLSYLRYNDMIKDVQKVQSKLENSFFGFVPGVDFAAKTLWEKNEKTLATDYLNQFCASVADNTLKEWTNLSRYLLIKYKDGNIMKEKDGAFERTETGLPPSPLMPGYPDSWKRNVVEQAGEKLKVIGDGH